ncbi:MAG: hypothetical protein ABI440_00310 [Casimicrobiaceae bacterium]
MAERPDAIELLDIARETLVALMAETDARHHYALRMVASAMAIAQREFASPPAPVGETLWQRVETCAASDVAAQQALHAQLVAATRARLRVSNPRFIDGH